MEQVKSQFPTTSAFEDALRREGITETMLRERYESDVRQEILAQRVVGREIRSTVEVTTDEVQKYFDEHKDELPQRPDEVQLAHIVAYPVDPAKDRAARERIETARERLLAGEDFAAVAADVSDDPSRNRGGELGWFEPGDLDPDFQAVVDTLALNTVSEPVHTRFGYHLVEVLERDGRRFHVRHVLAMVQPSQGDLERAEERATAARERVLAGESFEDVAAEMSDDPLTREQGGELGWTPMQALMPAVAEMIDSVGVNNISPVVPSDRGYHVFKILNRRAGGAYDFDEIRDQLRGYLEQQELEAAYDEWMAGVRDSAYVEIKGW
jgi:peptidyl-prolyl cis-trans isomerase SurA